MKMTKGMRKDITKEEIVYTKEEREQIRRQREAELLEQGSIGYRIAVLNDPFRRAVFEVKDNVEKDLIEIGKSKEFIARKESELNSGKITSELKPGVVMTSDELALEIRSAYSIMNNIVFNVPVHLNKLRYYVEKKDIDKKIVISMEEFDAYVKEIEERLQKEGFSLFVLD